MFPYFQAWNVGDFDFQYSQDPKNNGDFIFQYFHYKKTVTNQMSSISRRVENKNKYLSVFPGSGIIKYEHRGQLWATFGTDSFKSVVHFVATKKLLIS